MNGPGTSAPPNPSRDCRRLTSVSRRADPERIHQARRAAVRNGLTDYGMSVEDAERWCDAFELHAATEDLRREDSDYWTVRSAWIAEERAARRPGW
jgi:hypothetical protein